MLRFLPTKGIGGYGHRVNGKNKLFLREDVLLFIPADTQEEVNLETYEAHRVSRRRYLELKKTWDIFF